MHTRLTLVALLLASCTPTTPEPDWLPSEDEPRLVYRLVLDELGVRASARAELIVRAGPNEMLPSPLRLTVPHQWAGRTDLGDDLVDFRAEDALGRSLEVDRAPGVALVRTHRNSVVRLHYRVRPAARELTEAGRFRALGLPDLLLAYGRNLLVRPEAAWAQRVPVSLRLETTRPRAFWATTLGAAGDALHIREVSLAPLLDAVFVAGRPRQVRGASDPVVRMVADPALGPIEDALLATTERVVAYQMMTYGRPSPASTTGIIMGRADDLAVATGTGRPGGFVLEVGDSVRADGPELAELIAHENLHRYLGFEVVFDGATALETLWLKEGVVSYLATMTVVQSGLGPPNAYLDTLSQALTGYLSNEAQRHALGFDEGTAAGFWWDDGQRRRPYERGYLLAFWLDQRLRRVDDRLERAIAALIESHRGQSPLRLGEVATFFGRRAHDSTLAAQLETWVLEGGPLPWAEWFSAAGLEWLEVSEAAAYLGVETAREQGGAWRVTGVDPLGPVGRAGLRVGDRLARPPDVARLAPSEEAHLLVLRDGVSQPLTVQTAPGERARWQVVDAGGFFGDMGWGSPSRAQLVSP